MKCILILLVTLIDLALTKNLTLKQVHVIFRHGNRAPVASYPNDPYKDDSVYWPKGLGQLTKAGYQTEWNLGVWLRNRYTDLVKTVFDPREVHVVSTDYDRTLMSAYCVLASFFPAPKGDRVDPNVPWAPASIHTERAGTDTLINVADSCPRIAVAKKNVKNLQAVKQFYNQRSELFSNLTQLSGKMMRTAEDVGVLRDTLFVEDLHNLTLPKWASSYMQPMKEVALFSFLVNTYTDELKRLHSGPLLKQITAHMNDMGDNRNSKKLYMYSAHDHTIVNVLNSIGAFNEELPAYGSALVIEHHVINETAYTKLFYHNDSSLKSPYPLSLRGCEHLCPLSDWETILSHLIPANWNEECHATTKEPQLSLQSMVEVYDGTFVTTLILAWFSIVAFFIAILWLCCYYESPIRPSLLTRHSYGTLPQYVV